MEDGLQKDIERTEYYEQTCPGQEPSVHVYTNLPPSLAAHTFTWYTQPLEPYTGQRDRPPPRGTTQGTRNLPHLGECERVDYPAKGSPSRTGRSDTSPLERRWGQDRRAGDWTCERRSRARGVVPRQSVGPVVPLVLPPPLRQPSAHRWGGCRSSTGTTALTTQVWVSKTTIVRTKPLINIISSDGRGRDKRNNMKR